MSNQPFFHCTICSLHNKIFFFDFFTVNFFPRFHFIGILIQPKVLKNIISRIMTNFNDLHKPFPQQVIYCLIVSGWEQILFGSSLFVFIKFILILISCTSCRSYIISGQDQGRPFLSNLVCYPKLLHQVQIMNRFRLGINLVWTEVDLVQIKDVFVNFCL